MKTFLVDAFTNKPFSGNPAGVCILDSELSDDQMQLIAREINYSETAFVKKRQNGYSLRWFTPKTEVDLCGHATLATAHILYEAGLTDKAEVINFETKSGLLTARLIGSQVELNFPQMFVSECESNTIIEKAFDIKPVYVGKNDVLYLVEIDDLNRLVNIDPDFSLLQKCDRGEFIITAKSDNSFDFYSRFFAPGVGINEDPVTGSAHCYLGPYWYKKLNKKIMNAFQASERTGILECELIADSRILLRGQVITMNELKHVWMINK